MYWDGTLIERSGTAFVSFQASRSRLPLLARTARDDNQTRSRFKPRAFVSGPRQLGGVTFQFRAVVDGRRGGPRLDCDTHV
jgi:hypothetical protein